MTSEPTVRKKKKRKRRSKGIASIIFLLVLLVSLMGVLVYMWKSGMMFETIPSKVSKDEISDVSEPHAFITLGAMKEWDTPLAKSSLFSVLYLPGSKEVDTSFLPEVQGVESVILKGRTPVESFKRDYELGFGNPINYQQVPGVLGFRGNNFRNAPSYGYTNFSEREMEQVWSYTGVGSLMSSWDFAWSGTGWPGQALIIKWPKETRQIMNLYEVKKDKEDLIEVIYGALDGKVYFFDLEDGTQTRNPLNIGAPIKGTPALDPRGYPILYVGQGDRAPASSNMTDFGMRIISLIDFKLLHFIDGMDPMAPRDDWAASDSSPLIDAESDTLVWPSENGIIYTAKLNTVFDRENASVSVDPEFTNLKYESVATFAHGTKSSPAIYGRLMYLADNSGILTCIDLDTMEAVWSKPLDGSTDSTPLLSQEDDGIYVYIGTKFRLPENAEGQQQGNAYAYKIDAFTGKTIWRNTQAVHSSQDASGGVMGAPISGKLGIDNMVIFSFCMDRGVYSGNQLLAFDKKSGQKLWTYASSSYAWSSPVDIYDKKGQAYIILPDSSSILLAIDTRNGNEVAVKKMMMGNDVGGIVESSAAVYEDMLVIGTRRGLIAGFKFK